MQRSTLGSVTAALVASLLAGCGGGGGGGSVNPPPPPPNVAPTANAGTNQTVTAGVLVTLNGTASSDPDGTIASYAWSQTAGTPAVTLSSSTASQPTFTAPTVAAAATLTFSLVVTDNRGAASTAASVNVLVNPVVANGTVTGTVRFTRIPTSASGLNFGSPQLQPARQVLVRAVNATTQAVLASGSTDDSGNYSLQVAGGTNIQIVVVAQMLRDNSQPLPRWDMRAQDQDAASPTPYTYTDGQTFSSSLGTPHNVDIPSGLNAQGTVTGTRASAPFAVLDTVYQGMQLIRSVAPNTNFPALVLDWATDNPGGETFFDPNGTQHIVLSADVTEDTDEFDQHVIAHEFGHYIEFNFSRADNIGGAHGLGDKLDIRVAFGEGWGYAFAAMVLNDPVARDTFTSQTQFAGCSPLTNGNYFCTSTFNIDDNPPAPQDANGCWCSESSVWSLLWDIYDSGSETGDTVALGFQPIWNVLINEQKNTHAFTSIFSFIDALKRNNAGSAPAIDTLLAAQNTTSITDIYGSTETQFPNPPILNGNRALPVYTDITVGGGAATAVSANDAGHYNMLGNHRYFKFTLASARVITITVTTSNGDVNADPDFRMYRNGVFLSNVNGEKAPPQPETVSNFNASAGDYLIDAYDCANGCSADEGTPGDYNINVTVQ